jgi:hypothetical protein
MKLFYLLAVLVAVSVADDDQVFCECSLTIDCSNATRISEVRALAF